jgi:glycerophosphoryl diester phosphodiesterase
MRLVWQNNQTTEYYEEAKKKGLIIYGWTFQDDHKDFQNLF